MPVVPVRFFIFRSPAFAAAAAFTDPSFPACGLTVTGCGCRYPKHAIVLQIYLFFGKSPHSPLQKTPSSPCGDAADFSRKRKKACPPQRTDLPVESFINWDGMCLFRVIDQRRTQIPVEILIADFETFLLSDGRIVGVEFERSHAGSRYGSVRSHVVGFVAQFEFKIYNLIYNIYNFLNFNH